MGDLLLLHHALLLVLPQLPLQASLKGYEGLMLHRQLSRLRVNYGRQLPLQLRPLPLIGRAQSLCCCCGGGGSDGGARLLLLLLLLFAIRRGNTACPVAWFRVLVCMQCGARTWVLFCYRWTSWTQLIEAIPRKRQNAKMPSVVM